MLRIDPDQRRAFAKVRFHHFPGVFVFPRWFVARRQPHDGAWILKTDHGSGVRAGGRHQRAVVETDIGEEALVALDERTAKQRRGESHPAN